MKIKGQISESLMIGTVLALSGGFMDAYTYIGRGEVFANAQTGNIILLGINLSGGKWLMALRYALPVLSFSTGIALAHIVRHYFKKQQQLHWRQIVVLLEAVILLEVSFLPQTLNLLANALVSFACGIQVQSFRKIRGNGVATTMCIGNLRTATQCMCDYFLVKEEDAAKKSLLCYGIIIIFAIGAVIGNRCTLAWGNQAIIVSSLLMLVAFAMMFIEEEK